MKTNVVITHDIQQELKKFLDATAYTKICVITDQNTVKHCYPLIREVLKGKGILIQIPAGEEAKTIETCQKIWAYMTTAQLDRKALVINLGGGVIGDMGGFCASTYKRGIDFIQIPTTLLSQVDASVGGKLGVDFTEENGNVFKNHIGLFNNPKAVLIDTKFLSTLDHRELRSGFGEIIKHSLIADKATWEIISSRSFDQQNWDELAAHSVAFKSHITESDPQEKGIRKILNFGHTLGHAIEGFYLNSKKKLLHGEAIAIGMICETFISAKRGFVTMEDLQRISSYIVSVYGKPDIPAKDIDSIIALTLQDKKNENSEVLFSLLEEVGKGNYNISVGVEEMKESIEYYNSFTDYFYNSIRD
ncbi:MAG TPA: 3-dehydroquinate synthase [Cytophagaceae bacterium]|jgi:3-dehydroquinate synthase|nr:3-dehydroquinate synthase [Cytophagaceae bacterium]